MTRYLAAAFTWLVGITALALAAVGLTGAVYFGSSGQTPLAAPCAVMAAAGLATLGWLVTAANQRALSRKQHTLNLLIQMRHADLYDRNRKAIAKLSPGSTPVSAHLLDLLTDARAATNEEEAAFDQAAIYVLNYWEFVCAALVVGDLDAELVRRTVRQHIVGYHDKFADLIDHERATGQALVFRHLRTIADEWRDLT